MSKVISFSISDRYLDKLRSLYPALTDNLAAKQFLTDRLESSLGNSLDANLDDSLDGKLKSLIESELDDLLEGRLDATVGKLITSLSERMARLEERLDDSLDGRLDDMERLLRLQQSASIASPIPTGEPSPLPPSLPPGEPDRPAIETVTPEVSPSPPSPVKEAIEDSEKKITLPDTLIGSPIGIDKSSGGEGEPVKDAIGTVPGETDSSIKSATDAIELTNKEKAVILGIDDSNLSKWVRNGSIPKKYGNKCRFNENKTKIILI